MKSATIFSKSAYNGFHPHSSRARLSSILLHTAVIIHDPWVRLIGKFSFRNELLYSQFYRPWPLAMGRPLLRYSRRSLFALLVHHTAFAWPASHLHSTGQAKFGAFADRTFSEACPGSRTLNHLRQYICSFLLILDTGIKDVGVSHAAKVKVKFLPKESANKLTI